MLFTGHKVIGPINNIVIYCLYFIFKGSAYFQLDVGDNKDVTFFPSKFPDPLNSTHRLLGICVLEITKHCSSIYT